MIAPTSFFADYGCHVRILEETLALQDLGNRVTICTYHNGRNLDGLNIRRTLSIPWRQDYEVGSSRHKIAFDLLLSLASMQTALQCRPDIIHAHLHEGALIGHVISRIRHVPLVFDFQGSMTGEMVDHGFLNPQGPFFRAARWLEETIDHLSQAIVTSSRHAAGLLTNEFGCSPELIETVPDCVNAEFFSPGQDEGEVRRLKERWGVPHDRTVVAYLGLLAEYQGISHLLRAARIILERRDDVHFLVMGFPGVDRYRAFSRSLGILDHVTFTGQVRYEQAPLHLAMGDIGVAPKLSATEGSGKILNYMSMELPTVSFDTPVSREYLGDMGIYANSGDVGDLAKGITMLLDDPGRRARLGSALRESVSAHYTWMQAGQKIMNVYQRLLSRSV
jgi:glycosyltransferase involved in cell wall biosynthesis